MGTVLPHMRAKVVDSHGQTVTCGQAGEVIVSGYALQKGYWKDEAATEKAMYRDERDGPLWMRTGDLGTIDEEGLHHFVQLLVLEVVQLSSHLLLFARDVGYLRIVGRSKDMIIRGGENLFPKQIEDCIVCNQAVYSCCYTKKSS